VTLWNIGSGNGTKNVAQAIHFVLHGGNELIPVIAVWHFAIVEHVLGLGDVGSRMHVVGGAVGQTLYGLHVCNEACMSIDEGYVGAMWHGLGKVKTGLIGL
jgi:hypothetical protein